MESERKRSKVTHSRPHNLAVELGLSPGLLNAKIPALSTTLRCFQNQTLPRLLGSAARGQAQAGSRGALWASGSSQRPAGPWQYEMGIMISTPAPASLTQCPATLGLCPACWLYSATSLIPSLDVPMPTSLSESGYFHSGSGASPACCPSSMFFPESPQLWLREGPQLSCTWIS